MRYIYLLLTLTLTLTVIRGRGSERIGALGGVHKLFCPGERNCRAPHATASELTIGLVFVLVDG